MPITPGEILRFPRYMCEQLLAWHGVPWVNHMYVNKKLDAHALKKKKKPSVGVELRTGGDPHRSENSGWSCRDMRQWSKQKKCIATQFLQREFCFLAYDLFKVIKMTYDLLKVSKMTIKFLTCSNLAKWLF